MLERAAWGGREETVSPGCIAWKEKPDSERFRLPAITPPQWGQALPMYPSGKGFWQCGHALATLKPTSIALSETLPRH